LITAAFCAAKPKEKLVLRVHNQNLPSLNLGMIKENYRESDLLQQLASYISAGRWPSLSNYELLLLWLEVK